MQVLLNKINHAVVSEYSEGSEAKPPGAFPPQERRSYFPASMKRVCDLSRLRACNTMVLVSLRIVR